MKTTEEAADAYLSIYAAQMLPTDNKEIKQAVKDNYPLWVDPFSWCVCANITSGMYPKVRITLIKKFQDG